MLQWSISAYDDNPRRFEMLTKTTIALATALILGVASAALAANENEQPGGSRTFGAPGQGATQGVNSAFHSKAAAACQKKYKSYDPSDMTYLGKDGKRHSCS
jgi:BA14K-like protein